MNFRVAVHERHADAETAWREIESCGDGYVFQAFDWQRTWFENVGHREGLEPVIVEIATPGGEPALLLPLAVECRCGCRTLKLLGGRISDYLGPIVGPGWRDDDEFAALWRSIRGDLPAHDIVSFDKLPARIGARINPLLSLGARPHASSAHYASLGNDAAAFVRRRRSPRSLQTERRKARRLAERGDVQFVVAAGESGDHLLEAMLAQKSRSYREMGVADLFAQPGCRAFIETMTTRHRSLAVLFALTLDGEPLATLWGLKYRSRFYHLFPTYARNAHTNLSPGNLLLGHVFDWCVDNGIETYDFTVGDEDYKQHWCEHELTLYDVDTAVSLRGQPVAAARRSRARLKRAVKSSPRLFTAARRARRFFGGSRRDD